MNALVHRDYLVSAPVRIFMFADRIEIVSPGTLPNNLTVANIRAGNSNLRNPILASYVAKGVLPYRGLGTGVPRALDAWPHIDLRDDRDGGVFVATVHRKGIHSAVPEKAGTTTQKATQKTGSVPQKAGTATQKATQKVGSFPQKTGTATQKAGSVPQKAGATTQKVIELIAQAPRITRKQLAEVVGITPDGVKFHLRKLQQQGRLRRIGPDRGGHWEVVTKTGGRRSKKRE